MMVTAAEMESRCIGVELVSGLGDDCRPTQCTEAAASQHDVAEYQVAPDGGKQTGEEFDLVEHDTKAGGGPRLQSRVARCKSYDAGVPPLN